MAINNFNVGVGTTSQLTRYRYVATGGETSVSGSDADGKTLSYTVGLEQVFLNGVNLVRGQDYTATDGTSVGALSALVASDVVEVFAYVPFNIANALTVSTVDAKGDLLVGTGADAVGRLAVGTNGQLLSAASGETTGLKWANGGLTLIDTETFSAVTSVSVDNLFSATYKNYRLVLKIDTSSIPGDNLLLRFRTATSPADITAANYQYAWHVSSFNNTQSDSGATGQTSALNLSVSDIKMVMDINNPFEAIVTTFNFNSSSSASSFVGSGQYNATTSAGGLTIYTAGTSNLTGVLSVYGYNE
jgi:hypothetical protein